MGLTVSTIGRSDIGRVRNRNEDSLSLVPDAGIAVLADGMGGHPGGDVASRIAAETTVAHLGHVLSPDGLPDPEDAVAHLGQAMVESVDWAHRAVRAEGAREPVLEGMGTTLTAILVDARSRVFAIANVGDSRAYRLRAGRLRQLTRDDTWVQQRVDEAQLTPEQARKHPFGHMLTQCVGLADPPEPHLVTGFIEEGDSFLLCTDGLTGMLPDQDIEKALGETLADPEDADAPARALDRLIEMANQRGGHDNITVALVTVRPDPQGA